MLVEQCYDETNSFPQNELIGLTGQLRRAAISIPSNVAEGSRRLTTQAFMNHVGIARGSLAEVETVHRGGKASRLSPGVQGEGVG